MGIVRPEFGPTLPQLLGPRLRALPRWAHVVLAIVVVVVVIAVAARVLGGGNDKLHPVVVRAAQPFNFVYRAPFHRQTPQAGELARVGSRSQFMAVRALRLPPYRGDAAGTLPVYAAQQELRMGRTLPGFVWRADGRANINKIQGYEIVYQYRPGGQLTFGRRIYLLPTTTSRDGVELVLESRFSPAVANADAVGHNGALKTSLRSFRFGTQRP